MPFKSILRLERLRMFFSTISKGIIMKSRDADYMPGRAEEHGLDTIASLEWSPR